MTGVRKYFMDLLVPLIVLLLMIVIASQISAVFLSKANAQNIVVQIALNMVVSMGMFVVILTGGIDLAVGSVIAVAGVFCAGLMRDVPIAVAIVAAIALCTCLGTFVGLIVARLGIAPFIVTLGMMSFARGIAYWYTQSAPISWSSLQGAWFFLLIGSSNVLGVPLLALVWLGMILITAFMLRYTVIGRMVYCIGGNEQAVKLSGINVKRWKVFPYAFSGFCCGIGGILLTARLGVGAPSSGSGLEFDSIAAVVIGGASFNGGIGKVSGVVIGVFVLGIINNILDLLNVPAYPQMMLKGIIIVTAVILSTLREKRE